jgi:hypothetical protein
MLIGVRGGGWTPRRRLAMTPLAGIDAEVIDALDVGWDLDINTATHEPLPTSPNLPERVGAWSS